MNKLKYKMSNQPQTGRMVLAMILILVLTLGFVIFTWLPRLPEYDVPIYDGVIDLTSVDLDAAIVKLPVSWDYYPGELLTPADFNEGRTSSPRQFTPEDEQAYQTGTYRAILKVIPGKTYAMNAWSLDYATRIFVDGAEALNIGTVAADAEDFVPRMRNYILPVTPQAGSIEVIIQYANFSHHEGGAMRVIAFGLSDNVNGYAQSSLNTASMLGGALLLVAVFYFMLFIGGRGFPNFAFALCCFFLATRNQQFVISILPLDYSWSFVYRFVYINNIFTGMAFLLLVYSMFPSLLPRRIARAAVIGTIAVTLGLTVTALFSSLPVVARLVTPSYLVFIPAIICIVWTFGKVLMKGRSIDRITATGIAVLFVALLAEMILQRSMPEITRIGLAPFGMLTFVICQMLALGLENAALERLDRMKTEFLQDIKHDVRNPLYVISLGTDYISQCFDTGRVTDEGRSVLNTMQNEALRLGRMIDGMVELAMMDGKQANREKIDFAAMLISCAEALRLEANQKQNTLHIEIAPGLPYVYADVEQLPRVPINLLSNAVKYTDNGDITLEANVADSYISVRISDTGEGIPPDLLPRVFERGVSRKGGKGYGLYICKTIVEAHGGTIKIESEPGNGTSVTFTIPVYGGQSEVAKHE